jgi:hypothetical protein
MAYRPIKRVEVLTLTALLVITTGIAAAPVRNMLAPLVAHPLSQWLGRAPAAASTVQPETQSARVDSSADIELSAPLIAAPPRLSYTVASGGNGTTQSATESERASASSSDSGERRETRRGDNSRFRGSRSAGAQYGLGYGAMGRLDNPRQTNQRVGGDSESNRSTTQNASGSSGSGGVLGSDRKESKESKQVAKEEKSTDLFGEHKAGMPELKGDHKVKNSPQSGKGIGGGTVAVNPEPSTLFLFGTGIVAAAGAIRRRLR